MSMSNNSTERKQTISAEELLHAFPDSSGIRWNKTDFEDDEYGVPRAAHILSHMYMDGSPVGSVCMDCPYTNMGVKLTKSWNAAMR